MFKEINRNMLIQDGSLSGITQKLKAEFGLEIDLKRHG
jgi:hypothetical protein